MLSYANFSAYYKTGALVIQNRVFVFLKYGFDV